MYFPQSKTHIFQMAKVTMPRMEENKEDTRATDQGSKKTNHALSTVQIQSDQDPEERNTALPNTRFQIDQQPAAKNDSLQNVQIRTEGSFGRGDVVPPHGNIQVTDVTPYPGKSYRIYIRDIYKRYHKYDYIGGASVNKREW